MNTPKFDITEDDQDEFDDNDSRHFWFPAIVVMTLIVTMSFAVGYVLGKNVADDCIYTIHQR